MTDEELILMKDQVNYLMMGVSNLKELFDALSSGVASKRELQTIDTQRAGDIAEIRERIELLEARVKLLEEEV